MAKSAANQLTATVRTETGKGASRRARRAGKIPAVLYGHGADPQHLELPGHDFAAVLRHSGTNAVLTLDIDGKEQFALTKALAIHPIRGGSVGRVRFRQLISRDDEQSPFPTRLDRPSSSDLNEPRPKPGAVIQSRQSLKR